MRSRGKASVQFSLGYDRKMNAVAILMLTFLTLVASNSITIEKEWEKFKAKYKKVYNSPQEDQEKFENFRENFEYIQRHNSNESMTYKLEINREGDMNARESVMMLDDRRYGFYMTVFLSLFKPQVYRAQNFSLNDSFKTPETLDWRERGAVNKIKDQKLHQDCGSCYAFAAISAIESQYFIKSGKLFDLSEQEIVDCSSANQGCHGGHEEHVFMYLMKNGIALSKDYPYESKEGKCRSDDAQRSEVKVFGFAHLGGAEKMKQTVAQYGPVVAGINLVPETFRFYKKGIYDDPESLMAPANHVVVIVGYGTDEETGLDYWIARNSFSEDWGENGYMKILRDDTIFARPMSGFFPLMDESAWERNVPTNNIVALRVIAIFSLILTILVMICCCFCCYRLYRKYKY